MFCPQCGEEYAWDVMVCPVCDADTVDRLPGPEPMPDARLVRVLATGDAGLIAFAKSLLEGEDIDYFVRGDGLQDLFGLGRITGFSYAMGPAEFLVREDDEDRARALLKDLRLMPGMPARSDDRARWDDQARRDDQDRRVRFRLAGRVRRGSRSSPRRPGNLALRIEHNGSTSIPNLAAKLIIDIQVSVAALQPLQAYGSRLAAIGYVHVPSPDDSFSPFFHRPAQWPHSHHVHVVEQGGLEERRTLAFRDYLRDNPGEAREYERLKRHLAALNGGSDAESRENYARAKSGFIERIVALALAAGYPESQGTVTNP